MTINQFLGDNENSANEKTYNKSTIPLDVTANNVSAPYVFYIRSHWYNELSANIKKLSSSTSAGYTVIYAICGIGGSGKTQLANDYGFANKSNIVWNILADKPENLWRDYCDLAIKLKIDIVNPAPDKIDDKSWQNKICHKTNNALAKGYKWILIFDNVKKFEDIRQFFPAYGKQQGIVLITTRNLLLVSPENCLDINRGLNEDEAVQLLENTSRIKTNTNDPSIKHLAKDLDYLPLNLRIAGAIIMKRKQLNQTQQFPYEDYRNHLRNLSVKQIEEEQRLSVSNLPDDYNRTQYIIISDAIKQLDKSNPEAGRLLTFCGYLSPTNIPKTLLENFVRITLYPTILQSIWNLLRGKDNALSDSTVHSKCDELLSVILESSLLQIVPNKLAYDIHRVVQQVSRVHHVLSSVQSDHILDAVLAIFTRIYQTKAGNIDNLITVYGPVLSCRRIGGYLRSSDCIQIWQPILPHMVVLADHTELLQTASVHCRFAFMYYLGMLQDIFGNFRQAKQYFWNAYVDVMSLERGSDDGSGMGIVFSIRSSAPYESMRAFLLDAMGKCYSNLGNYKNAKKLLTYALHIRRYSMSRDENEIAITCNNLGFVDFNLGNYEEAKKLFERSLLLYPKKDDSMSDVLALHEKYYYIASTTNNLGLTHLRLGNPNMAKELHEKALSVLSKYYNYDHYLVAETKNNLGLAHFSLGNYEEAKKLYEQTLSILEKHYGPDHGRIVNTLNNLANVCDALGDKENAANLRNRASHINVDNDTSVEKPLTLLGAAVDMFWDLLRLIRL